MATDMFGWDSPTLPVLEVPEVQEVDFFIKECMKLLVVNRPNPVHTAGLDKGHPATPAQQEDSDDSGNPVAPSPTRVPELIRRSQVIHGPAVRVQTRFSLY